MKKRKIIMQVSLKKLFVLRSKRHFNEIRTIYDVLLKYCYRYSQFTSTIFGQITRGFLIQFVWYRHLHFTFILFSDMLFCH